MSKIMHLLTHDLYAHRGLLLAWTAIVVLHPLLALVPWAGAGSPRGALLLLVPGALLVVARLALGVVVLGTILQEDSPVDAQAFWRTRPIGAGAMAATKLALAALLFVLLPLTVVTVTAAVARVPLLHWPSMIGQVLFTDAAVAGLTLAMATRTRRISSLLLGVIGCLLGAYLLLVMILDMRRIAPLAQWVTADMLDPDLALPTARVWASLGLWAAAAVGYAGHRRRNAFALIAGATVAAIAVTWLVPSARLHGRELPADLVVAASVSGDRVYAELVAGREDLIGVVAEPTVGGVLPTDRTQAFLLDGRLTAPGYDKTARGMHDPRSVAGGLDQPQVPLLAVLSRADFAALAGNTVRFSGRLNVEVNRATRVDSGPLAAGVRVEAAGARLAIHKVLDWSDDIPQPLAEALLTETYVPGGWRIRGPEYRLRDLTSGCHTPLYVRPMPGSEMAYLALLPTLARPFTARRGMLVAVDKGTCRPVPSNSVVEAYELRHQVRPIAVSVTFTMPTQVRSARVVAGPR